MEKGKAKLIIREHSGYKEFKKAIEQGLKIKQYFGQYQFLISTSKGSLSIVQIWDIFNNRWFWEIGIFNSRGDVKDTERFPDFDSAQKRAWEILL